MTTIDLKVLDARMAEQLPAYATAGSAGEQCPPQSAGAREPAVTTERKTSR